MGFFYWCSSTGVIHSNNKRLKVQIKRHEYIPIAQKFNGHIHCLFHCPQETAYRTLPTGYCTQETVTIPPPPTHTHTHTHTYTHTCTHTHLSLERPVSVWQSHTIVVSFPVYATPLHTPLSLSWAACIGPAEPYDCYR
jgi:ABC-type nickel/cobalt efflux system permease component RcnA